MSESTPSTDKRSLSRRFEQLVGAIKSWLETAEGLGKIVGLSLSNLMVLIIGRFNKVVDPWGQWYALGWWLANATLFVCICCFCYSVWMKFWKYRVLSSTEPPETHNTVDDEQPASGIEFSGAVVDVSPDRVSDPRPEWMTFWTKREWFAVGLLLVLVMGYCVIYRERIEVQIDLWRGIDSIIIVYDPTNDSINSIVSEMHRDLKEQLGQRRIRLKLRGIIARPSSTSSDTPLETLRANQGFSGALWVRTKTEEQPVDGQPRKLVVEETLAGNWPAWGANVEVPFETDTARWLGLEILDYLAICACEANDYEAADSLMEVKIAGYVRPDDDIFDRPAFALCWAETSYVLGKSLPTKEVLERVKGVVPLYSQQLPIAVSRPLFSLAYTQMLLGEGDLKEAKDHANTLAVVFRNSENYEQEAEARIMQGEIAIIEALGRTDAAEKKQRLTQAIEYFGRAIELGSQPGQSQATDSSIPAVEPSLQPEQAKFAALVGSGRAFLLRAQANPNLAEADLQEAARSLERALNANAGACQKKSVGQWLASIYSQLGEKEQATQHLGAARQVNCPNPYVVTIQPASIINGSLLIRVDMNEPNVAYLQVDLLKDGDSAPIYSSVIRVVPDQHEYPVHVDISTLPADQLEFKYAEGAVPELSVEASYIFRVVNLDPQLSFSLDQPVTIKGDLKLGLQWKPPTEDAPVKPDDSIGVTAWVQGSLASNSPAIELEDPSILDRIDFWVQAISTPSQPKKLMSQDKESGQYRATYTVGNQASDELILNAGVSPKETRGAPRKYLVPTGQVVYRVQTVTPTLSPTPAPTATPTPDERAVQVLVVLGSPVLYQAPDLGSAVVMTVPMECPVLYISTPINLEKGKPAWYEVEYLAGDAEILGWVPRDAVGTVFELPRFRLNELAVVLPTRAVVYSRPHPEEATGTFLERCTVLGIIESRESREEWVRVRVLSSKGGGPRGGWVKSVDIGRRAISLP